MLWTACIMWRMTYTFWTVLTVCRTHCILVFSLPTRFCSRRLIRKWCCTRTSKSMLILSLKSWYCHCPVSRWIPMTDGQKPLVMLVSQVPMFHFDRVLPFTSAFCILIRILHSLRGFSCENFNGLFFHAYQHIISILAFKKKLETFLFSKRLCWFYFIIAF